MISYFTDDDNNTETRTVELDFDGCAQEYEVILLDKTHDAECVGTVSAGDSINIEPNTVILLK